MRRRIPYGIAVVAMIVAMLAVMGVPGLSFGQSSTLHGGSPTDVYLQRALTQEECVPDRINVDGVSIMPLDIELTQPSHVLVQFSFQVAGLDPREQVQINAQLDGSGDGFASLFFGNSRGGPPGSATSLFPGPLEGTHHVDIYAAVSGERGLVYPTLDASLSSCVLTVWVIPAA